MIAVESAATGEDVDADADAVVQSCLLEVERGWRNRAYSKVNKRKSYAGAWTGRREQTRACVDNDLRYVRVQ